MQLSAIEGINHRACGYWNLAIVRTSPRGLTLVEMIIVLVILAALTGIAVNSLEPIAEQARYESTQQTLINFDEAIVSRDFTSDRVARYSGFVADIGRLPIAIGTDPETQASELWNPGSLPIYSIANFDDPDTSETEAIAVAAGWRGPYLLLPPGPSVLRDGFGRSFGIFDTTGDAASAGDSIGNLVSSGANGALNSSDVDYDRDLQLPGGVWTSGRYEGSIEVTVKDATGSNPELDSTQTLRVKLYGPDPVDNNGSQGIVAEQTVAGPSPSTVPISLTFSQHSIGPRVLMAYVTTGDSPNQVTVESSLPKQIVLAPGMNPSVELDLDP